MGVTALSWRLFPAPFTAYISTGGKFGSVRLINTMKIYSITLVHDWGQLNTMYSEYTYHLG